MLAKVAQTVFERANLISLWLTESKIKHDKTSIAEKMKTEQEVKCCETNSAIHIFKRSDNVATKISADCEVHQQTEKVLKKILMAVCMILT